MNKNKEIEKAIDKGIKFLKKSQARDGSFISLTSPSSHSFKKAVKCESVFSSALVLSSLNLFKESKEIDIIKKNTANFLLSQKSEHWTFNYWARDSKQSKKMPYPDDLDDTSCTLAALYEHDPDLIDGEVLAKAVIVLTALEQKEGGPYSTWLVPPDAKAVWKDIDLAVNNNIAYFLSQHDVELPGIIELTEEAIKSKKYISPYYPNKYPIIYFISRWYRGKLKDVIAKQLLKELNSQKIKLNALDTALSVSALLNFEVSHEQVEAGISHILKSQTKTAKDKTSGNFWKPYLFYTGINPVGDKKMYYAGSSALTTAFCLETLNKFKSQSSNSKIPTKKSKIESEENIHKEVIKKAKQRFSILKNDLKKQALKILNKTIKADKDKQIVLLPHFFQNSLNSLTSRQGLDVNDELIIELGLANLYGWIAYTIYDDFLDEEGNPKLLPVANVCLRELTEIFENVLPEEIGFKEFFNKVMDTVDGANAWEVLNTRCLTLTKSKSLKLPNYGNLKQLAEKSLGHALGPAAVLFSLGYKENSKEVKSLMAFFKHYIIARQLNDDAHDWEKDLKNGQINAVAVQILKKFRSIKSKLLKTKHKITNKKEIIDDKDIEKLQQIFWNDVVVGVSDNILKHTTLAEKKLKVLSIINEKSLIEKILKPIENSAHKTQHEHKEAFKFLKAYK